MSYKFSNEMKLQEEKKWIIAEVDKSNDEDLLQAVRNLLNFARKKNVDDFFKPMTLDEFHGRIEESRSDIENGRIIEHSQVKKIIKSWRKEK